MTRAELRQLAREATSAAASKETFSGELATATMLDAVERGVELGLACGLSYAAARYDSIGELRSAVDELVAEEGPPS